MHYNIVCLPRSQINWGSQGRQILGWKWFWVVAVKVTAMAFELIYSCVYLEGQDNVVFILYFWAQNVQHRVQHTEETQQVFMGWKITHKVTNI